MGNLGNLSSPSRAHGRKPSIHTRRCSSGGSGAGAEAPGAWRSFAMRRVVVTGLGVVAPNGVGKEAFWSACLNGRSGVGPIRSFDASCHPVKVAAEVHDFDAAPFLPPPQRKSLKIMGRAMRFAVGAAGLAMQ